MGEQRGPLQKQGLGTVWVVLVIAIYRYRLPGTDEYGIEAAGFKCPVITLAEAFDVCGVESGCGRHVFFRCSDTG